MANTEEPGGENAPRIYAGGGGRPLPFVRTAALVFAVVGVVFFIVATVQYLDAAGAPLLQRTSAAQAVLDGGSALATSVKETVSPAVERTRRLVASPDIAAAMKSGDRELIEELCNRAILDATEIDVVALFDATGRIQAMNTIYADGSTIPANRIDLVMGRDYSQTDVVTRCLNNSAGTELLEFQTSCDITPALFASSGLSVAHSAPIFDREEGGQIGVVSVRMRFERITALSEGRSVAGGRGSIYFVTDDGRYFDEEINAGLVEPPFSPQVLAPLVAPLAAGDTRYSVAQRQDHYISLFRMDGIQTIDGGGIQILIAVARDWVSREATLARVVGAGIPVGMGLLCLITGGLVWTVDIDRRRRRELAASEAQFRSLVNNIPGVSYRCLMDEHGTMLFISDEIERLSGYPASDFRFNKVRTFSDVIHPDDQDDVTNQILAAVERREPFAIEYRILHSNGDMRWVREKGQGVYAEAGDAEPEYLDGAIFDFTDNVKMEQKLAAERTRLMAFVEHTPAAVAMFDRDMNYIAVSERWLTDYKLVGQSVIGQPLGEVLPNCPKGWTAARARCLGGSVERCDNDLWSPAGTSRDVALRWELRPWYGEAGQVAGLMLFSQDITEDKKLRADLEDRNQSLTATMEHLDEARVAADAANRAKSEFLANMSHEIRTPLTSILGYSDMLLEIDSSPEESERREGVGSTIRQAGAHLLTLINDILDLSKIEAGKMDLETVDTSVPKIVAEIESLMRVRASERDTQLEIALESPIPHTIQSDPTRMRQILVNLVGNAAKFTDGGSIKVLIDFYARDGANFMRFTVEDTGAGMSPEQAAHLFNPFTQADNSVTRKHGGTGLGLTISRRLGNLLGGDVWLDWTEPGKGSRFVFELPVEASGDKPMVTKLSESSAVEEAGAIGGAVESVSAEQRAIHISCRVLVAEDSAVNQRLISFQLKKAGADVDLSLNGKIALDMIGDVEARGESYDLLVSDMQMPEMDGYTLARTLRATGNSIPIIALTAHAMSEARAKCLEAGCDDYITKPIDTDQLLKICKRWSAGRPD